MYIIDYINNNEISFKFGEGLLNLAHMASHEDDEVFDIGDILDEQFVEYIKPSNERQEVILVDIYEKLTYYASAYSENVTPFFHTTDPEIHKIFEEDIEVSYKGQTYIIYKELLDYINAYD